MPYVISFNNAALKAAGLSEVSRGVDDAKRSNSEPATPASASTEKDQHAAVTKTAEQEQKEASDSAKEVNATEQKNLDAMYKFADQWAQLRYCQLKYTDRMGGIGMLFNPNCSPGAIGTIYLRAPGVYIDYFVTEVSHEIRLGVPDHGSATTNIGFNCGRMGMYQSAPLSTGLPKLDLFDGFDATKSAKVAAAFVKDIQ
jgi:hypothetical protein